MVCIIEQQVHDKKTKGKDIINLQKKKKIVLKNHYIYYETKNNRKKKSSSPILSGNSILNFSSIFNPNSHHSLHHWFVRILNEELDKFNDFYVDKEEEFVIRFQELKQRIELVKEKSCKDGVFISETNFSDEMMLIRKDCHYSWGDGASQKLQLLNFAGIIKILKKYDKRIGRLLPVNFIQLALDNCFSPHNL